MFVLKIGGSALTDKKTGAIFADEVAERVARELGSEKCVIVHGVGYYGHKLAGASGLHRGLQNNQVAWAQLRVEVKKLTRKIVDVLVSHGIPAVEVSPADIMHATAGKIMFFDLEVVKKFLDMGFVPVLHADGAVDDVSGLSVISGDTIATEIVMRLGASKLIYGTDVDGIYGEDGEVIPYLDNPENLPLWDIHDFSGGMRNKVEEALRLDGVEVQVINLRKDGTLARAIAGEDVGTIIKR